MYIRDIRAQGERDFQGDRVSVLPVCIDNRGHSLWPVAIVSVISKYREWLPSRTSQTAENSSASDLPPPWNNLIIWVLCTNGGGMISFCYQSIPLWNHLFSTFNSYRNDKWTWNRGLSHMNWKHTIHLTSILEFSENN